MGDYESVAQTYGERQEGMEHRERTVPDQP